MRRFLKVFLLLALPFVSLAQSGTIDSLKGALQTEKTDTGRVLLLASLSRAYVYSRPDTALVLAQEGLSLAKKTGFARGEATSLNGIGRIFLTTGNYPKALQLNLEALKKAEAIGEQALAGRILANIGIIYSYQGDYRQAVAYTKKSQALAESEHDRSGILTCLLNLGDSYEKLNLPDTALRYTNQAYALAIEQKEADAIAIALVNLGNIYSKLGQDAVALQNYRLALASFFQEENDDALCESYLGMAALFQKRGLQDSSLHYAKLSLATGQKGGFTDRVMKASQFLTNYYTAIHNVDSAFLYQSATIAAKDALYSQEKAREIQSLGYEETVRQQQIKEAKADAQTQLKFNMLFGGLGTLLLAAFLLYRNNRQKQSANALLTQQKAKVESTLQELKTTQSQLVQAEKMASLGELTAGIAHEIQNPLNFVNNFSEINTELLNELKAEIEKGDYDEVKAIATDIAENSQKIGHHGKRADAIVKGMLQHSRKNEGQKEATDINKLADEYLRLSYHGLRARDKSFNASLKTDFDERIGKVNVVPQDIGRVLLNLFNNSFYAVNEKKKKLIDGYEPTVSVCTKTLNNKIEIQVKDNGMGISKSSIDKIFQPFFTTKPTGQGTGLGLSLSYDIIKAHGGELNVQTKEGEGATFIIALQT